MHAPKFDCTSYYCTYLHFLVLYSGCLFGFLYKKMVTNGLQIGTFMVFVTTPSKMKA